MRHGNRARARARVYERSLSLTTRSVCTRVHQRLVHYSFSSCQSVFLLPRELVDRPIFRAFRIFRDDRESMASRTMSLVSRTMKCRATRRALTITICIALQVVVHASPAEPLPSTLLDGIGNVANTATNFRESISDITRYRGKLNIQNVKEQ